MDVKYTNQISVSDYNLLRKAVDWSEIEGRQAKAGIENSAFLISAVQNNKTIGLARVVSDGGYIAIVVDVIVLPEYQGNGIGKTMMQKVMEHLHNSLQEGQRMFVNLMAAKDMETFYTQFGFETRPNEKSGAGMTQVISHQPS